MTAISMQGTRAVAGRKGWWRHKRNRRLVVRYAVATAVTVFFLFPVYWLFIMAFKTPEEVFASPPVWVPSQIDFDGFIELFRDGDVKTVLNGLIIASTSTVFAMMLGTMGAYSWTPKNSSRFVAVYPR